MALDECHMVTDNVPSHQHNVYVMDQEDLIETYVR